MLISKIPLKSILVFLAIAILLATTIGPAGDKTALAQPSQAHEAAPAQLPEANSAETSFVLNLPHILSNSVTAKFFGVEFEDWYYGNANIAQKASQAGMVWVRLPVFPWRDIEPTRYNPAVYNWSVVNETALANLAARNFNMIGTVRFTPSWAQMYPPDTYCGPVASDSLDEFAQYMAALVARYSVPPYNILYWEIGNEPDVDPNLVHGSSNIGCWGDDTKTYYGGNYYATMLKTVYPAIKAANPKAQVLIGGLLMDCDPTHPPPGKSCQPTLFFEGILRGGGAAYFDIVSFHGYGFYWYGAIDEETNPNWAYRGGLLLGKIDYLKEIMAKYHISKPIFHTEGSLICHPYNAAECNPPVPDFYETQADYVVWMFVRALAADMQVSIWYPMIEGWYYTGLMQSDLTPKPAYNAYQFMTQELHGATYVRQLNNYLQVRVYEFSAPNRRIWVAWAPDYLSYNITLPAGVIRVVDKYGNAIEPVNGQITVRRPVYIELTP